MVYISLRAILITGICLAIIVLLYFLYHFTFTGSAESRELVVCHAGSLSIPLRELAAVFEKKYHVKVILKPAGSVMIVRWVTDLGERCDVVALADYRLIPMYMVPKYATWYIVFASNSIVIAYTNKSKYADYITKHPDKIFYILARPDVRYGFSNPNDDPCGYRAVGVIALASLYYKNISILNKLVIKKISGAKYEFRNKTLHIYIPAAFSVKGNLIVRPKSVDLIALLESGIIDYAFEYKSVAIQHRLRFIELPPELNLGDPRYANFYSRVVVHILVGTDKERAIVLGPIVYGLTIPKTAVNKKYALLFIKLLLSNVGRRVFEKNGQMFLKVPLGFGNVPVELRDYVKIINTTVTKS